MTAKAYVVELEAALRGNNVTLTSYITDTFIPSILPTLRLSTISLQLYHTRLKHILAYRKLSNKYIQDITIQDVAIFLNKYPAHYSNLHRSMLVILFKHMLMSGIATTNPAIMTMRKRHIKQGTRLSKDQYEAIYNASPKWFKLALEMAVLTCQRREDLVRMKWVDIKDGYLHVIQQKTKKHGKSAYIRIQINDELSKALRRCKEFTPALQCPYIVQRKPLRWRKSKYKDHQDLRKTHHE